MTSTAIDPGAATHQGRMGLQYTQLEQYPNLKPNPLSFSSAFDFVAVDAATYIAARFGLTPSAVTSLDMIADPPAVTSLGMIEDPAP
jgi:hypothetical protein